LVRVLEASDLLNIGVGGKNKRYEIVTISEQIAGLSAWIAFRLAAGGGVAEPITYCGGG
jgi:hypothetical protein